MLNKKELNHLENAMVSALAELETGGCHSEENHYAQGVMYGIAVTLDFEHGTNSGQLMMDMLKDRVEERVNAMVKRINR